MVSQHHGRTYYVRRAEADRLQSPTRLPELYKHEHAQGVACRHISPDHFNGLTGPPGKPSKVVSSSCGMRSDALDLQGTTLFDKASRWKLLQNIKDDCVWYFGRVDRRISKVSIVAIDKSKIYEDDELFMKVHYNLTDLRNNNEEGHWDADRFCGLFIGRDPGQFPSGRRSADECLIRSR